MIKINRSDPPNDTKMDRKKEQELWKIKTEIDQGATSVSFKNRNLWTEKPVKQFLHKSQHGKCCYCEAEQWIINSDVEHFRPKGKVDESENHLGYWWLAYEWDNLLIACGTCNRSYKKSKFPLLNEKDRAYNKTDKLDQEKPYLINPLKEDPERFIEYKIPVVDWEKEESVMVEAIGKDKRGRRTVNELTGINDIEVKRERGEKIKNCEMDLELLKKVNEREEYKKRFDKWTSHKREFSGLMKFYLKYLKKEGRIPE